VRWIVAESRPYADQRNCGGCGTPVWGRTAISYACTSGAPWCCSMELLRAADAGERRAQIGMSTKDVLPTPCIIERRIKAQYPSWPDAIVALKCDCCGHEMVVAKHGRAVLSHARAVMRQHTWASNPPEVRR
jgi:hypothetical protein